MKQEYLLEVTKIRPDAPDIVSIFFQKPADFAYNAGDCIDIGFKDSALGKKTFSFASSPLEDDLYITYKRGISDYKKKMQTLDVGDSVIATHYGSNFVFHPGKKSIFIAGGVGVTPLRSMIYTSLQGISQEEMILVYLNNSDDFVFEAEFLDWQKVHPHFRYIPLNTVQKGRISKNILIQHLPTVSSSPYDFYISGPPLMIDAVSTIIEDLGLADHIIHTDSFDGYTQELA